MTELIKQLVKEIENTFKIYEVKFYFVREEVFTRMFQDKLMKELNFKKKFNKKESAEKYKKEIEDYLSEMNLSKTILKEKAEEEGNRYFGYMTIEIGEKEEEEIDKKEDLEKIMSEFMSEFEPENLLFD